MTTGDIEHCGSDRSPGGVLCHLIASNFAGGPEKQVLESVPRLRALGWNAVIGSFRERRESVEIIERARESGCDTFLIETGSPFSPDAIRQLKRQLAAHRVDVLVSHGYKPNLIGRVAVARTSTVQLPLVRGYTAEDRKVRLYESIDRRGLRLFPRVLCVSDATRRMLIRCGLRAERIDVLHNAVAVRDHGFRAIDLRAEFAWPPDTRVIAAAGRLSPEKGQRDLVSAFALLTARMPAARLVILGAGREAPRLRQQIQAGGLTDRVRLAGFRAPILPYLAAADLVVNPSLTEGLPNVVLEAMSVHTPVVATNVGGVAEIVHHGRTGWLVPPSDPRALAEAMAEALTDAMRAKLMAGRAFMLVTTRFSFESQARRLAELCERALIAKRNPNGRRHHESEVSVHAGAQPIDRELPLCDR